VALEKYGPKENSWELVENLQNAPDAMAKFHNLHPNAPGWDYGTHKLYTLEGGGG